MTRAHASGNFVIPSDVPKILAMIARGDRRHDIAAWFGLNQGRVKEVEDGEHGGTALADKGLLPPAGSPGLKARQLRAAGGKVHEILTQQGPQGLGEALAKLGKALADFDKNE